MTSTTKSGPSPEVPQRQVTDVADDALPPALGAAADLWRRSGAVARVPVEGASMDPLLRDGDTVRVRADEDVCPGQVAVARTAGGLVVHRVVARRGDEIVLRGDNTPAADGPLAAAAILGRVTAVEGRRGRRLDTPGARAVGGLTASYARAQAALGRGPRPRHVPRVALALERRLIPPAPAEDELLLLVARLTVAPAAAARAEELAAGGLDWDRFAARARLGQLGPLAYRGMRQLGDGVAPPAAVDGLRALYAGNWARTRALDEILEAVLAPLAAAGILVMGHKGVALAATVYPDPVLRIAGDLDLSVRDEDRAEAERATRDIRQRLVAENPDRRSQSGFHVELDGTAHHDVDPAHAAGGGRWRATTFDWAALWSRAETIEVAGQPMLAPCPTDLLLTLVANGVRRGFTPLRLVADVAATIARRGDEIDWDAFGAAARATGLDRRAWIALGLAADWFGAVVPADLLEPPPDLRPAWYERALLAAKHRRPLTRLPTRVLWAGSTAAAVRAAAGLARIRPAELPRSRPSAGVRPAR